MVAFVGEPVTAEDMLEKWESSVGPVANRRKALDHFVGYVRWAAKQRLGSVFEATYDTGGVLIARKVAGSLPVAKVPIPD